MNDYWRLFDRVILEQETESSPLSKIVKIINKIICWRCFLCFQDCFSIIDLIMEIGMEQVKIKGIGTKHEIASSKQRFQSDDSEGSDLSYESSLTDQQDNNAGRTEFFKEEMARFFINYPELLNRSIIKENSSQEELDHPDKQQRIGRNWQSIADQILNQAKESSTSLQALARRISLYRLKIDQSDIIDLILQQKVAILKDLEAQTQQKGNENTLLGRQKNDKPHQQQNNDSNVYYSWLNQKIVKSKYVDRNHSSTSKVQNKRSASHDTDKVQIDKAIGHSINKQGKSLKKGLSTEVKIQKKIKPAVTKGNEIADNKVVNENQQVKFQILEESQVTNRKSKDGIVWKHLINFQPKTEIGRQLSQQIRKQGGDEASIKKTIVNFLSNYKDMINNQVINKVTLSQKIQKLYTDDAKELLMFYPSKITNYDSAPLNTTNSFRQNSQQDSFLKLLRQVNDGPLIKYWRQLQQNKL